LDNFLPGVLTVHGNSSGGKPLFKKFITCAKKIIYVFLYFLFVCCQLDENTLRNVVNGPKEIIRFWWESGLSSVSRNRLTTFCRPFVNFAFLWLCYQIVCCIRNNCLYFDYYC